MFKPTLKESPLRIRYDRASDVVYITSRPGEPARSREEQPGLLWRYDVESGALTGVTVLDFSTFWRPRKAELIAQTADRFSLPRQVAKEMFDRVE